MHSLLFYPRAKRYRGRVGSEVELKATKKSKAAEAGSVSLADWASAKRAQFKQWDEVVIPED
jgi:hypothetical protein